MREQVMPDIDTTNTNYLRKVARSLRNHRDEVALTWSAEEIDRLRRDREILLGAVRCLMRLAEPEEIAAKQYLEEVDQESSPHRWLASVFSGCHRLLRDTSEADAQNVAWERYCTEEPG